VRGRKGSDLDNTKWLETIDQTKDEILLILILSNDGLRTFSIVLFDKFSSRLSKKRVRVK
jgi:hypothetical protein